MASSSDMADMKKEGPLGGSDPIPVTSSAVVACLSPADLRPDVDPLTGQVRVDPRRAELSAQDAAALEHALRAGDHWGAPVVAVAAGPATIEPVLREASATGAAVLRLAWDEGATSRDQTGADLAGDPQRLAAALALVITRSGPPRLVVCGDRSARHGVGAVPALLAYHLGAAQALGLVSFSVDGDSVVGERRLDGGWRERVRVRGPAVCSVEAAGVRLRRASLAASREAARAPVPVVRVPIAAVETGDRTEVRYGPSRSYRPRTRVVAAPSGSTEDRLRALTGALAGHEPPRIVGPAAAAAAADELLDFLTRHGYLPQQGR
jgi:electron transfer flavoprotein beta subunit